MPQYMLLLRDAPQTFQHLSPQEIQQVIERYKAWGDRLRRAGLLVDSHKLRDGEGRVVARESGRVRVTDGPYAEAKEVMGGYFTITAASYEEALAHIQDCPHLEFGTIEIREIQNV